MGLVHLLLSTLVITVALGGSSEQTSQSGAFTALAEAPFGIILVWVIAALLAVLGAYQLADGLDAPMKLLCLVNPQFERLRRR